MLQLKKQLKNILNAHGMTATQLARQSGIPKQTISNWLAGVPPSGIRHLKRIAVVLNVSLDELCFGERRKPEALAEKSGHPGMEWLSPHTVFYTVGFDGYIKNIASDLKSHGGWSAEETLARPMMEFVYFEDRMRLHVQLTKQIQQSRVIKDLEHRILCKDGGIKWIRWDALVSVKDQALFVLSEDRSNDYPKISFVSGPVSLKSLIASAVEFYRFAHSVDGIGYRMETTDVVGWLPHSEAQISAVIFGSIHSVLNEVKKYEGRNVHISLREESHRWIVDIQGDASSGIRSKIINLEVLRHWVKPYSGTIEQVPGSLPRIQITLRNA